MTLAGYAIGGVLIGITAPEFVLGLNAVTFLASALLLLTLPSIPAPRGLGMPHESWWHQVTAGARRMAGHPRLRVVLVALPVATAAVGMGNALQIPLLRGAVDASAAAIGFVLATHAFGLVFGAWAGPFLPKRTSTFLLGMVVMGVGLLPMLFTSSIPLIAAGILVSGLGNGVVIIRFRTTMQMSTAPEDRASTIAFIYSFSFGVGVLGAALGGPGGQSSSTCVRRSPSPSACSCSPRWPARSPTSSTATATTRSRPRWATTPSPAWVPRRPGCASLTQPGEAHRPPIGR